MLIDLKRCLLSFKNVAITSLLLLLLVRLLLLLQLLLRLSLLILTILTITITLTIRVIIISIKITTEASPPPLNTYNETSGLKEVSPHPDTGTNTETNRSESLGVVFFLTLSCSLEAITYTGGGRNIKKEGINGAIHYFPVGGKRLLTKIHTRGSEKANKAAFNFALL